MVKNIEMLGPALLPADSYLRYLLEARDLFVEGFDYGSVALAEWEQIQRRSRLQSKE